MRKGNMDFFLPNLTVLKKCQRFSYFDYFLNLITVGDFEWYSYAKYMYRYNREITETEIRKELQHE